MRYKLEWEIVNLNALGKYCNADPRWYSNTTQIVPNSQIPDEDWHSVTKEVKTFGEIEHQYETLKAWAAADKEFVRNVRLYEVAVEPEWRLIEK